MSMTTRSVRMAFFLAECLGYIVVLIPLGLALGHWRVFVAHRSTMQLVMMAICAGAWLAALSASFMVSWVGLRHYRQRIATTGDVGIGGFQASRRWRVRRNRALMVWAAGMLGVILSIAFA